MARRSPNNPRYQKSAQLGSTRRSAASAKPKRGRGEAGSSAGGKKGKGGTKTAVPFNPDTPEFKQLRRIWFGLLMVAMAFALAAFLLKAEGVLGTAILAASYLCLFAAFYIDFAKIRPMRKAWLAERSGDKKSGGAAKASGDKQSGGKDKG